MSKERAQVAYATFRGGFDHSAPPHWEDAPAWVRDAVLVAYLQGKLDGGPAPLPHDDICWLSRVFNQFARPTAGSQADRVNDWLKTQIAASRSVMLGRDGT